MTLRLTSPNQRPAILHPSLFSSPKMSFHLPIYADALTHASITNLAIWDEGLIDSCHSSSRFSFVLGRISLDQLGSS
jgi:hypothetical protein